MKKRLTCSVKYFCLGALLIFLGSVLLCGLGLTVVLPYEVTRNWPEVSCMVVNTSYSSRVCSCEYQAREAISEVDRVRCVDSYPCLHIAVTYSEHGSSSSSPGSDRRFHPDPRTTNVSLFYDHHQQRSYRVVVSRDGNDQSRDGEKTNRTIIGHLYRSWEDEFFKTCTLHECGAAEWNINQVYEFERLWGQRGQTFRCYYDPDDVFQVILERRAASEMIHALLWPTVLLATGLLMWLGLWIGCWQVEMEKYPQPSIDRTRGDIAISGRLLIY